jgi:exonuclease SbcC
VLEKLRIRNFQKHRKLDLVFHPGVTTVIGPSDSGKSAVYRALKLVCLNKPAGTAFITAGEESSKVTLYFDGRKVSRARGGPKLNTYGLDAATYQAMGAEVPDKVREALGISALNFQSQHDAAYWFGEADSKVAKELNSIVNLGEIDELFTRLNADLRKAKAEYDVRVQNVDALRTKKREAESALDLDAALRVLETLDDEIRTEEAKASTLNTLIEAAECARVSRSELKSLMKSLDVVRAAGDEAAAEWKRTD